MREGRLTHHVQKRPDSLLQQRFVLVVSDDQLYNRVGCVLSELLQERPNCFIITHVPRVYVRGNANLNDCRMTVAFDDGFGAFRCVCKILQGPESFRRTCPTISVSGDDVEDAAHCAYGVGSVGGAWLLLHMHTVGT